MLMWECRHQRRHGDYVRVSFFLIGSSRIHSEKGLGVGRMNAVGVELSLLVQNVFTAHAYHSVYACDLLK